MLFDFVNHVILYFVSAKRENAVSEGCSKKASQSHSENTGDRVTSW